MLLLRVLNVVSRTRSVLAIGRAAMSALADTSLSDDEKERISQSSSVRLFGHLIWITSAVVVAFGAPLAVIWLIDLTGVRLFDDVLSALASWPFLVGATVLFFLVILIGKRRPREL
jgi:hypothetical protein